MENQKSSVKWDHLATLIQPQQTQYQPYGVIWATLG